MEVDLVADMTVINPFDFFLEKYAEEFPFQYDPVLERELIPYREGAPARPKASGPGTRPAKREKCARTIIWWS